MGKRSGRTGVEKDSYRYTNYVEGNAVRRLSAVPDVRKEISTEEDKRRRQEKNRQLKRRQREVERERKLGRGYLVFVTAAVCLASVVVGYTITIQTNISSSMANVAVLKDQIETLRTDNELAEKKLESQLDLESIRDIAINQLGMVYPSREQIVRYDVKNNDYMNQYEDIPGK